MSIDTACSIMSDLCDMLQTIRLRPHMVGPEELHELLEAAGFALVARNPPNARYKHPDLTEMALTLRMEVPMFLAAGSVAKAIAALDEVVICDEG